MENRDLDKYLGEMYGILYKSGFYGIQALAIIGKILRLYYETHDFFIVRQAFLKMSNDILFSIEQSGLYNQLGYIVGDIVNFSQKEIAMAYKKLLDDKISKKDAKQTEDFYVTLIQSFIKCSPSITKVVDPCVGTGQLLRGLMDYRIEGYDKDAYCVEIARTFLYFYNEGYLNKNWITSRNSLISDFWNDDVFYVMDPPMGNRLPIPDGEEYEFLRRYTSFNNSQIQSEYLFLSKVVFSKGRGNYACLMPESFLYARNRLKEIFRRELFKNSIDVVVYPPNNSRGINKIILYGHKFNHPNNSSKIYFISAKTFDVSEQEAMQIARWCIEGQVQDPYINSENFVITTRERNELSLLDNVFQHTNVVKKVSSNDKSVNEIIEGIQEANKRYLDAINQFNSILKQIREKLKSEPPLQEKISTKRRSQPWFKTTKNDVANAISSYVVKSSDWVELKYENIYLETLQTEIEKLNILYKANRLKIENNKLYVYSRRQLSDYVNNQSFWMAVYNFNLSDENIRKKLHLLSEEQKDIYKTLIQFRYQKVSQENKEDIWKKFSKTSIFSTINTLKILNLVYEIDELDEVDDNNQFDISIGKYIPYTPLIRVDFEGDGESA